MTMNALVDDDFIFPSQSQRNNYGISLCQISECDDFQNSQEDIFMSQSIQNTTTNIQSSFVKRATLNENTNEKNMDEIEKRDTFSKSSNIFDIKKKNRKNKRKRKKKDILMNYNKNLISELKISSHYDSSNNKSVSNNTLCSSLVSKNKIETSPLVFAEEAIYSEEKIVLTSGIIFPTQSTQSIHFNLEDNSSQIIGIPKEICMKPEDSFEKFLPKLNFQTKIMDFKLSVSCLVILNSETNNIIQKFILSVNELKPVQKMEKKCDESQVDRFNEKLPAFSNDKKNRENDNFENSELCHTGMERMKWYNEYLLPVKLDELIKYSSSKINNSNDQEKVIVCTNRENLEGNMTEELDIFCDTTSF